MFLASYRRGPLLFSAATVASCIIVYLLSQQFYWRHDLTRDRRFSLNQPSIDLVRQLQEPIQIKLFVSETLPPRFVPTFDFIQTLVGEYRAYGRGKISVSYTDPKANLAAVEEAYQLGISETMANVATQDRMEAVPLWFGMVMVCGDRSEAFPALQSIEDLEWEITSALIRLTREVASKICLIGPTYRDGQGIVFDIQRDIKPIHEALAKRFHVTQIRLEPETELELTEYKAVFAWSLHHFTERQLYALDQYLMHSGSLLLLASNLRIDPLYLTVHEVPASLADEFYDHLGFRVSRDLVCDTRNTKIKYTDTRPPVLAPYPLFPEIDLRGGGNEPHPSVAGLDRLVLPWASSLHTVPRPGIRTTVVGATSQQAWLQTEPWIIDPKKLPGPSSFNQYPVGLALSGRFRSFFDRPPEGVETDHRDRCRDDSTILVWGSEHLLTQAHNPSIPAWAEQTADYLTKGFQLAGIDRREHALQPIRELTPGEKTLVKWTGVTAGPLFILVLGLVYHLRRRRRDVSAYRDQV